MAAFGALVGALVSAPSPVLALGNGSGASNSTIGCPPGYRVERQGRTSVCVPPERPIPFSGNLQDGPIRYAAPTEKQLDDLRRFDLKEGFQGINVYPMQKDEQLNFQGWVMASNVNDITIPKIPKSMTELPAPYTFAGRDKCHFARFTRFPESMVQPGDILVYFVPDTSDKSKSLYRNLVNGMGHAAVVTERRDGTIMHIDSPRSWSKPNFRGKSFHIIRLRQFPQGIRSNQDLEAWLANPEKREQLKAFITARNFRVAAVNTYTNQLYDAGYSYSSPGYTKILMDREWLKSVIDKGHTAGLDFYCSELAYTPLGLAGVDRPASRSLRETLQVADEFLKRTSAREKISRQEAIKNGIDEMGVEYNGADNVILDAILKRIIPASKFLPNGGEQSIRTILDGPPSDGEKKVEMAPSSVRRWLSSTTISPADFFNSIYDTKSDYFYVGTYVEGGLSEVRNKSLNEGQADRSVGTCD